ncbi:ribosomal RNA-processing protein RRP9 [Ascoidea rubescens DSM 1968]|uniref:WD40 repeat-like protein n=1 Tax=Ascoidea rubescens DSM 1968 TaxID=1344418 RepID=A0A1D2VN47_9ASCO|nr:WD40 repeat-like protein [Ascoidea rubescens DSM 1968]ODV62975.1 WD40 repeat-like protein [Ascoidea rubescens DSM 1968]
MEEEDFFFDAKDLDNDIIARRLQYDVANQNGKVYKHYGDDLNLKFNKIKKSLTRVSFNCLQGIDIYYPYAYTASKDGTVAKYNIKDFNSKPKLIKFHKSELMKQNTNKNLDNEEGKEDKQIEHSDVILTMAISPDGQYLVTGGKDGKLIIWSTERLIPIKLLLHLKDKRRSRNEILSISFRKDEKLNQLYVASSDLKIRTFSVNDYAQLETLYGHQDLIVDIDALREEKCITVGSRDKTAMLWKISEETRLTFRGGDFKKPNKKQKTNDKKVKKKTKENVIEGQEESDFFNEGSIDCVSLIDSTHFITGSDNGSISLWSSSKKKPIFTERVAHGIIPALESVKASAETDEKKRKLQIPPKKPYWITTIKSIPYSDLFISGSWNGQLIVWQLDAKLSSFKKKYCINEVKGAITKIGSVEITEYENYLLMDSETGKKEKIRILASVSKEHRLGRWIEVGNGARNSIYSVCLELKKKSPSETL